MNRLKEITNSTKNVLSSNLEVPVYDRVRDGQGLEHRAPFVRVERPTTELIQQNKINKRLSVSLLINCFSAERDLVEINSLESQVRNALDLVDLNMSGRKQVRKPLGLASTPTTYETKEGRKIWQSSLEFEIIIHES